MSYDYFGSTAHQDVSANPERISYYWGGGIAGSGLIFLNALGSTITSGMTTDQKLLAFCSYFAYDHANYAQSTVTELWPLLDAANLDCDNYCALAIELFYVARPRSPLRILFLGWNGGAVGNHAQIAAEAAGAPTLLLDPTIGLTARLPEGKTLNILGEHYHVPSDHWKVPWTATNKGTPATQKPLVVDALEDGLYEADDLMFFHATDAVSTCTAKWRSKPASSQWATPGA